MHPKSLLILPSLDVGTSSDGRIKLTKKFIDGVRMYVDHWRGPVRLIAQPSKSDDSGNLDEVWVHPKELPFEVFVCDFASDTARAEIAKSAVVQGGTDHRLNWLPDFCSSRRVKYVLVSEQSLRTRLQIIDADKLSPVIAWRRKVWAWRQERANRAAAKASFAVHCNGVPTYDAYKALNSRTLLFFDSRVHSAMLPEEPRLVRAVGSRSTQKPIRLAFSGRLDPIKGVDHLVLVAKELRDRGVEFRLDIFGDGPLRPSLMEAISRYQLEGLVHLGGVLEFYTELMPKIRDEIDLFICCHRQGDPSCTYLETMACGVPIVGYANEAFEGLTRHCNAGVCVPMNDTAAMVNAIQQLVNAPNDLACMAKIGLDFAKKHAFELEFQRRILDMSEISENRLLER